MIGKFKVITLCGSMRFMEQFYEVQERLGLEGYIVLMPIMHKHHTWSKDYDPDYIGDLVIDLHNTKIDMSDEIFVINVNGYIGESTAREILYAKSKGKVIKYLEDSYIGGELIPNKEEEINMNFGEALEAVKQGKKIAREGWNGKGMFVYYIPANSYSACTDVAKEEFGEMVKYNPYFAIKTVNGTVSTWAPSVNDCLAEDWRIVE